MPFNQDLDLQRLFAGEVRERADRLIEGARTVADGGGDEELFAEMYREGHTIKGTARMMGFTALSDAGKLLEDTWRELRDGDHTPSPELAEALEELSENLVPAIEADPSAGTPELGAGVRKVRRALRVEPEPPVGTLPEGVPGAQMAAENADLGGLLGTIDSWAFGENVRVNAVSLFRLINEVCSLRVDTEALGGLVSEVTRSTEDADLVHSALSRLGEAVAATDKAVLGLQEQAVDLAAAPLTEITSTFPQLVRYLARKAGKDVRFELVGDGHAADRQVLERLSDPLRQLLVNAIEHGVEPSEVREAVGKSPTATVALRADVSDHRLVIVVEDDGRGIDWDSVRDSAVRRGMLSARESSDVEALRSLLFTPHFSTGVPGELVGDGMGLATVAAAAEVLHGSLTLETEPGEFTRIVVTVPTSRALQDAVLVTAAGQTWGIPELAVLDRLPVAAVRIDHTGSRPTMRWQGQQIPVASFAETVGLADETQPERVLVVSSTVGPVGFLVAGDVGRRQVAARELGPVLHGVPHLTGAAILGGGDVAVLVDPGRLAERARDQGGRPGPRRRVLVIDDSRGARQVVGGALGSAGFEVDLAGSPTEALSALADQSFDAIVMDYVLPTMDGATLVGRVRELGITAPIVMLSGVATVQDQGRALDAGADAYLDKDDVRKGALAEVIAELVRR